MGQWYRWERDGDLPIIGRFLGFGIGVRKGADTLFVGIGKGKCLGIRYEQLVRAVRVVRCSGCQRRSLARVERGYWECDQCGYSTERDE